ncbi:glycosyltransferase [Candidatus Igneacidithiobacillus taiwanensis]|uniref:glycosyltransferase n=1 Tax=Candidatus Igneacidithiobacillus taiwanensis TaxID=1945924 RepID=UPI00289DBAD5|nr:glycosyltransferase [Candidatus Igneacidithiobacillus taiwanensis]
MNINDRLETNINPNPTRGNENPRISIAMATYNGEKFIREQLDSLAKQTILPFELVVSDDGSTDQTIQIVHDFAKTSPFPVHIYINDINLHYTGNFLKSASLCHGEIIAFCDQDDIWEERKLKECITKILSAKADLVLHEGRIIDRYGHPTTKKAPDLSDSSKWSFPPPPNKMFGKTLGFAMVVRYKVIEELLKWWDWDEYISLRKKHGSPLGHDILVYSCCIGKRNIGFIEDELVRYRVHGGNVCARASITQGYLDKFKYFFRYLKFDMKKYTEQGEKLAAEAVFLRAYLKRATNTKFIGLEQLADWFDQRARLWIKRSEVYDRRRSKLKRLGTVAYLLYSGSYVSSREHKLGINALMKDILVGSLMPFQGKEK